MSPIAHLHPARTPAGVLTGRFRRVSRLDDDDAGSAGVARAVARAKQGDREALRYLYIRYADNVYGYVLLASSATSTRPRTSRSTSSPSS